MTIACDLQSPVAKIGLTYGDLDDAPALDTLAS
jgi:hypothetical protein